ncbi:MAG: PorT family protein [Bacteroidales bacterium]|nr:PorT family protein [Bacteroidales bacterium]MCF8456614.1 PorT family protein [Bacteroidales bacterium]
MKKFIATGILSILFILFFVDLYASSPYIILKKKQPTSPLSVNGFMKKRWGPEIIIGGKADINFSKIKGADDSDAKMIMGPTFGAVARLQNSEGIAFETGILYSAKGYKNKLSVENTPIEIFHEDFMVNLNYIDIPFLLRISFHENFIYNIDLGAYTSFLVSAQKDGTSTTEYGGTFYEPISYNGDVKKDYHSFDLGLLIAGGVQYQLTKKRKGTNISCFANAGIQIGIRTISSIEEADFNNRTYQIGLGILFHLDQ